jgi:hypothetical protein
LTKYLGAVEQSTGYSIMNHHATYMPTCAVEFVFLPDSRVMRYLGKVGEMDETCLPHREHSVTISHITVSPCHS